MTRKRRPAPAKPRPAPPSPEHLDVEALAAAQGVRSVASPEELAADFWPVEETADEFIAAVRRWRRERGTGAAGE
jgi:hypothetical protein